jgi:hypothetical protein
MNDLAMLTERELGEAEEKLLNLRLAIQTRMWQFMSVNMKVMFEGIYGKIAKRTCYLFTCCNTYFRDYAKQKV